MAANKVKSIIVNNYLDMNNAKSSFTVRENIKNCVEVNNYLANSYFIIKGDLVLRGKVVNRKTREDYMTY